MKRSIIAFGVALASVWPLGSATLGVNVLVLSSNFQACDDAVVQALKAGGHQATLGPTFSNFTDGVDLGGYDVVYLQCNYNYTSPAMPDGGQQALLDFVDGGGGLVTAEWTLFDVQTKFKLLNRALPGFYLYFGTDTSETFTEVTPDAVLNAGLAESFEFPLENIAGTEGQITHKCGATVFYDSEGLDDGVVGWDYGQGRVMSFSTANGAAQVQDGVFAKLFCNSMSWAAAGGGNPPPQSYADCDGDGFLDLFDFLCFFNAFNVQEEYSDCDGDGAFTLFDFLCFVNVYNKGC